LQWHTPQEFQKRKLDVCLKMLEKLKDAHTLDCIPGTTKGEMGDI